MFWKHIAGGDQEPAVLEKVFDGGFPHGSVFENKPDDTGVWNTQPGFRLMLASARRDGRSVYATNTMLATIGITRITQYDHSGNRQMLHSSTVASAATNEHRIHMIVFVLSVVVGQMYFFPVLNVVPFFNNMIKIDVGLKAIMIKMKILQMWNKCMYPA